jgi:hypothetical protein
LIRDPLAAVNRRVRRAIRAGGRRIWTAADLDSRAGSASTAPGTAIAILRLQDGQIRDAWVLRAETYAAANAPLIAARADIALAQVWGGGLLAAVDGVRFVVPVRSIDARPNPRYFGRRRGVTLLNLVNDQAVGLAGHRARRVGHPARLAARDRPDLPPGRRPPPGGRHQRHRLVQRHGVRADATARL